MAGSPADLLRRIDPFTRLSEPDLRKVAKVLKSRRLNRNQVLFRQGERADALYIVASGRMRISASDRPGHERILAFVGPGEIIGEMGVLSGEPRSATAVASTDAELLQLRKADFDGLVANNLEVMRDLARGVVNRREATQQRALDESDAGRGYRHGLITTVFSPRGGAGTSTIAVNLAVALAQRAPDRVILLDLNIPFGHVPVLLNLSPRTSMAAMSAISLRQMDRENLEFYLTTHQESSLRVLSAILRPEEGELVTAEHVRAAVETLRNQFAYVVIDLGRSFSEVNITAIEATHNLLVVCTPDRVGVRGVSESQRIFRELLGLRANPMQYILNHPSPYEPVSTEQVEQLLNVRLLAAIPFGGDTVVRAALEGQPVVMRWPSSATSKAITRLGELLEQQLAEARAIAPASFLTIS
jgi:CRP-like cAMP-binding protein